MDKEKIRSLMMEYLEGGLSTKDEETFKSQISGDEELRLELEQLRQLHQGLEQAGEWKTPPSDMRSDFLMMLEGEKARLAPEETTKQVWLTSNNWLRVAASVALLMIGFAAGYFLQGPAQTDDTMLAELQEEMKTMKQMMMVSMLQDQSASERIKAVSYANNLETADPEVIGTLLNTLNNDESPNVRLAAANALKSFADNDTVRVSLIRSLEKQNEPILQITLINMMIEWKEQRAINQLKKIIENQEVQEVVREQAEIGVALLI